MSKTLPAVDVVLERGQPRWTSPDFQAPGVRDELKYTRRHELHQNAATETYTFRNRLDETALPMRRWQFAYPANHLGGAGAHWSGAYYRWDPVEFKLGSHYTQRYGARIFEDGITAQDWPLTYEELESYYDRFDYLVGASGFAGNLKGVPQPGGNPFEPWRSRPYPNPPMRVAQASALFGEAAAKLGYHPYVQPSALATRPYVNSEGLHMGKPESLVKVYALHNRIRLVSSDAVVDAAGQAIRGIIELYLAPNVAKEQLEQVVLKIKDDPLKVFSETCREEFRRLDAGG